MALVTHFTEIHKNANRVHEPVECGYTSFEHRGNRYIQLDTYGSPGREIPGKVSQSIQFDEAAAAQLLELIGRAFPAPR